MLMLYFPVTKIIKMSANEKWQTNWQSFHFFQKIWNIPEIGLHLQPNRNGAIE